MSNFDLFFLDIVGLKGVVLFVGILFFISAYKNSQYLFSWFEDQTYGTKEYITKKLELLQKTVKGDHITYALLGLVFIPSTILFTLLTILGLFKLAIGAWLIFAFIGLKIPRPIMDYLVERRIEKYQDQLVDGLNLLSNGIRAGLSVPQALGLVVGELPAPISEEFNLILQQNRIGSPLEECFEDLARRIPNEDTLMFVSSINILRETGGNLAEVFDTIVEVIRERIRLEQKIKTYTAQGKAQGLLIFSMPFALLLINAVTSPETVKVFFNNPIGIVLLIFSFFLTFLGGFVIRKILQIKV